MRIALYLQYIDKNNKKGLFPVRGKDKRKQKCGKYLSYDVNVRRSLFAGIMVVVLHCDANSELKEKSVERRLIVLVSATSG